MDVPDPTYGYTLAALLAVEAPPAPDDFAAFWQARYARARDIDVAAVRSPTGTPALWGRVRYDVEFTSTDGIRLGGWLTLPAEGPVTRGLVVGHGYGGCDGPWYDLDGAAILFPCARGLPTRGLVPGIPANPAWHVRHGISHRDTYVHGGCVEDVWCAVSALLQLVPSAAARVDYAGISFGGGIGALALPWEPRIARAALWLPSFGNHPLRLTLPCAGSGEAVRHYARQHPSVVDALRYFDAAIAARFIRIPVHLGLALADPAVPPPGQFAIFNALAGPSARYLLSAGHCSYEGQAAEEAALLAAQHAFLTDP